MTTRRPAHPLALPLALALLLLGLLVPTQAVAQAAAQASPAAVAGGVSGRVVAPAGTSPKSLLVQLVDVSHLRRTITTRPDAQGRFSFAGDQRPELFAVLVCEAGGEPCKHVSTRIAERYVGPANAAPSLMGLRAYYETTDASPALTLRTVRLVRPATATVKIRNGAAPRRARSIELSGMSKPHTSNTLVFRGLAPGRHLVRAFGQQRVFSVGAGASKVVTFGTRLAKVTGRIVVGGRPRSGVPVALTGVSGTPVRRTTNADGRYTFPELNPAPRLTYELRIGGPGTPKALKRFTLDPGQVKRVDLNVAPGSRGWIDVVIDGTTPKRVGHVLLVSKSGAVVLETSVLYGRVRVDGLAPATYLVYARWFPSSVRRVVNAWRTVTVRAGKGTTVSLEPLTGPGSITVKAQPGNDIVISAPGPAGTGDLPLVRGKKIVSGDTTTFPDVPDGTYTVSLSGTYNPSHPEPEPQVVQVSGGNVTVDLAAAPRQGGLRGRLVDPATGRPWPWTGDMVSWITCTGRADSDQTSWTQDAVDLEVRLEHLVSGDYSCSLGQVTPDPGAPTLVTGDKTLPVRGTLRVLPDQERVVDFTVPLTP